MEHRRETVEPSTDHMDGARQGDCGTLHGPHGWSTAERLWNPPRTTWMEQGRETVEDSTDHIDGGMAVSSLCFQLGPHMVFPFTFLNRKLIVLFVTITKLYIQNRHNKENI